MKNLYIAKNTAVYSWSPTRIHYDATVIFTSLLHTSDMHQQGRWDVKLWSSEDGVHSCIWSLQPQPLVQLVTSSGERKQREQEEGKSAIQLSVLDRRTIKTLRWEKKLFTPCHTSLSTKSARIKNSRQSSAMWACDELHSTCTYILWVIQLGSRYKNTNNRLSNPSSWFQQETFTSPRP